MYPQEIVRTNKGRREFKPPYGYTQHPQDKMLYIANYEKLYALEKALEYIEEGATFRAAAKWLRGTIEEYVSHVFLYLEREKRQFNYEKARTNPNIRRWKPSEKKKLLNAAKKRSSASIGQEAEQH